MKCALTCLTVVLLLIAFAYCTWTGNLVFATLWAVLNVPVCRYSYLAVCCVVLAITLYIHLRDKRI